MEFPSAPCIHINQQGQVNGQLYRVKLMDKSEDRSPDHRTSVDWTTEVKRPDAAKYWLSAIIESADDAVISKTLDGVITTWNTGAQRLFGYTAEEAIGKPVTMLIPDDHPDEEPQILARIRSGERIDHYETVRVRKDGTLIDISLTVSPIRDENNRIIGASKIARDITEKKRAEAALREQTEIIETVNQLGQTLAAELDLHKLVQAVTSAATEISDARFGAFFYNVRNERGESFMLYALSGVPREAFAHFPMPRNTEIFAPTFRGEGTVLIDDVRKDPRYGKNSPYYGMPEGHLPVTSYLAVPVISRSGEVYGGLFFGHPDAGVFTERAARIIEGIAATASIAMDNAKLYEAAKIARNAAEESSRLKEEFLATISHELRTPLNAILGWSNMLRSGRMQPEVTAKALDTIERNARAQAQLIEDLLDVSRIITGKFKMDVRPIDPASFTEAAIESVQPTADAKGIRLIKVIDTGAVSVPGDPVRLQQVVWNLLSNAVKFTPRGGKVQVNLARVNSHVEIAVSDTGQGIPPEFLPHVFDRFRQAEQTVNRQHGGLGVGLAIVRHLVEMHGGSVAAASEGKDQGSIFTVRLPVSPVYQVDPLEGRIHPGAQHLLLSPQPADRLDHIKVLVVDDEEDTRDLLRAGLTECGADVSVSSSAEDAVKVLRDWNPDVLISDIGMPLVDGYEFIRQVRSLPSDRGGTIPAVALTAYARFEDRLKALRAGYEMHVPKPVELSELVTVILSLLRRRQH
jgi:PAS domain S-box-containing protein